MLIKNLSNEAIKKLSAFGFNKTSSINHERQGGNALWGWLSFTPLMYAAYRGDIDLVKELIINDADLNIKDEFFEFTALMWAAYAGRDKVVKHLLDKGADFRHQSEYQGKLRDAYSLSKKESCCSMVGFWQRAEKVLGTADFDNTRSILNSYQKR
jgi:ankyrin repeat protein